MPAPPPIRPMSRGASKAFVVACLLAIGASAFGTAWYLTRLAKMNKPQIEATGGGAPADSNATRGFGVTDGEE